VAVWARRVQARTTPHLMEAYVVTHVANEQRGTLKRSAKGKERRKKEKGQTTKHLFPDGVLCASARRHSKGSRTQLHLTPRWDGGTSP
jgi:hypothetical protein